MAPLRCAICSKVATRYFLTLDNSLWAVCSDHTEPFLSNSIELDPETYDVEVEDEDVVGQR